MYETVLPEIKPVSCYDGDEQNNFPTNYFIGMNIKVHVNEMPAKLALPFDIIIIVE